MGKESSIIFVHREIQVVTSNWVTFNGSCRLSYRVRQFGSQKYTSRIRLPLSYPGQDITRWPRWIAMLCPVVQISPKPSCAAWSFFQTVSCSGSKCLASEINDAKKMDIHNSPLFRALPLICIVGIWRHCWNLCCDIGWRHMPRPVFQWSRHLPLKSSEWSAQNKKKRGTQF